ncbi:MAG: hypothetical protein CMJ72_08760 [Planctomycetaceae bacterium]|nr:hypothetical protein [Planctomycetaceae bacterium]HCK40091.1 hypothetical protein [Planctomycetaceae bacterium]
MNGLQFAVLVDYLINPNLKNQYSRTGFKILLMPAIEKIDNTIRVSILEFFLYSRFSKEST